MYSGLKVRNFRHLVFAQTVATAILGRQVVDPVLV
jgi:hypothetical protein